MLLAGKAFDPKQMHRAAVTDDPQPVECACGSTPGDANRIATLHRLHPQRDLLRQLNGKLPAPVAGEEAVRKAYEHAVFGQPADISVGESVLARVATAKRR